MKIQKRQRPGSLHRRRVLEFALFAAPWVIGFLAFQLYPLAQSLQISFSLLQVSAAGVKWIPIGFTNYKQALLVDPVFTRYLVQSILQTILQIPLILSFSLAAAALMKQDLIGTKFFRTLFFLPVVVGSSAVIQQLFNTGGPGSSTNGVPLIIVGGFITGLTRVLGPTLGNEVLAIFTHLSLVLWQSGVQTLLFIAALYSVPGTYYEVARIDGANAWQTFLKVTLPSISPMILLVTIYTMVNSFTEPILNPLLNYISTVGFGSAGNLGEAGAMGWMYFVAIFIVVAVAFRYAQRHVFYAGER